MIYLYIIGYVIAGFIFLTVYHRDIATGEYTPPNDEPQWFKPFVFVGWPIVGIFYVCVWIDGAAEWAGKKWAEKRKPKQ